MPADPRVSSGAASRAASTSRTSSTSSTSADPTSAVVAGPSPRGSGGPDLLPRRRDRHRQVHHSDQPRQLSQLSQLSQHGQPSHSSQPNQHGQRRRAGQRRPHRADRRRQRAAYRRDLRHREREIRRRLATPPPVYPLGDDIDVEPHPTDLPSTLRRFIRTRWRLVVAALPLALAAILFVTTGADGESAHSSGPAPSTDGDTSPTSAGGDPRASHPGLSFLTPPTHVPAPADPGLVADVAEVAEAADGPAGNGRGPAPTVADSSAPAPPAGHRAVAIRFAAPDAVALAGVGDEIDVVGLSGDILVAGVEVIQDRSTAQSSVLVVAVPVDEAPGVAAAAAAQDVTLLVAVPEVPSPDHGD